MERNDKGKETSAEPRYAISVAARMVGVHAQTLRYYERMGLLKPSRSQGNIRLYSQKDIDLLRRVKSLMNDLGVNLAGVEVILNMAEKMEALEQDVQHLRAIIARYQSPQALPSGTERKRRSRRPQPVA